MKEEVVKKIAQTTQEKALRYIGLSAYIILFIIILVLCLVSISEAVKMMTATSEIIERYPFGTEMGWSYLSKEIYEISNTLSAYIFGQALIVSLLLYKLRQRIVGIIVAVLPMVLFYYIESKFGAALH